MSLIRAQRRLLLRYLTGVCINISKIIFKATVSAAESIKAKGGALMVNQGNEYCFTILKKSDRFPALFPEDFIVPRVQNQNTQVSKVKFRVLY